MDPGNDSSTLAYELPALAVIALFPAFLIELVVALISNTLLLALLVKARRVQSNTNIFLSSMVASNMLSLVPVLAMVIVLVKRRWILGEGICEVSRFFVTAIQFPNLMLHVCISRDRYYAVLRFFEWTPYTRRTYLYVALVWVLAVVFGGAGVLAGGAEFEGNDTANTIVSCLAPHLQRAYDQAAYSTAWIVLFAMTGLTYVGAAVVSVVNYGYVLRKLLAVKSIRAHHTLENASVLINCDSRDPPIEWRSEVRTLKSVFTAFLLNVMAFLSLYGYYAAILIKSAVEGRTFDEVSDPVVLVAMMLLYLLPSVNPAVFLILNTKFRRRMRGLLRWQLWPDFGPGDCRESMQISVRDLYRNNPVIADNRRNKIVPLSPCDSSTYAVPRTVLRNTWTLAEQRENLDISP